MKNLLIALVFSFSLSVAHASGPVSLAADPCPGKNIKAISGGTDCGSIDPKCDGSNSVSVSACTLAEKKAQVEEAVTKWNKDCKNYCETIQSTSHTCEAENKANDKNGQACVAHQYQAIVEKVCQCRGEKKKFDNTTSGTVSN